MRVLVVFNIGRLNGHKLRFDDTVEVLVVDDVVCSKKLRWCSYTVGDGVLLSPDIAGIVVDVDDRDDVRPHRGAPAAVRVRVVRAGYTLVDGGAFALTPRGRAIEGHAPPLLGR